MAPNTDEWNYDDDGDCGPCHWPVKSMGHAQSPIDFKLSIIKPIKLHDNLKFVRYDKPINGHIVNNGHSIQFLIDSMLAPEIYGGGLGQKYRFVQYHFHWGPNEHEGSEHTVGGLHYAAELHLVHQGVEDPKRFAVLGIFLIIGQDGDTLHAEETVLKKLINSGSSCAMQNVVLNSKLPHNKHSFVRYHGSLTTPPCTECVTWTVFTEPISVTKHQLSLLRHIKDYRGKPVHNNCRPLQKDNDRSIYLAC
uniref:Carbonic anhydrase n=1 Tax=Acrobeloides nanus TaxID=290746 RepID=A0A914E5C6_9BILA